MSVEVIVDFDHNDEPVVSVKGVRGKACKALTNDLEAKLGTVTHTETTPEYNQIEVKHGQRISNNR